MFESVGAFSRRCLVSTFGVLACSASVLVGTAAAQTTIVLNQAGSEVTDTTLRSGAYANTNFDNYPLITRRSATEPDWERRALLKFDTETHVPAGARITSATLTLTVKKGLGTAGQNRAIRAYRVVGGFLESEATWNTRMNTDRWSSPGGDVAENYGTAWSSNVPGSKVTFNVTASFRTPLTATTGLRYTESSSPMTDSRGRRATGEYYGSEEPTVSRRPTLTIVTGSTATSSSTSSTLKVLQWNIPQGKNIDGQVNWIASVRPDVISFNEMMSYHLASYASKLKAKTGQNWTYKFEVIEGRGSIGVAVFSRLPIESEMATQLSYMRSAQDVRITVNGRTINFTSTHLAHESSSYRIRQTKELKAWLATIQENRIVAGDFNWYPGTTEINLMAETYYDAWAVAKSKGTAVSAASNPDGNTRNSRIDYVWQSKGASQLTITGAQSTRRDTTLSDHRPLLVTFRVN